MTSTSVNITDFESEIPGEFNSFNEFCFPPIETFNNKGNKQVWQIRAGLLKSEDKAALIAKNSELESDNRDFDTLYIKPTKEHYDGTKIDNLIGSLKVYARLINGPKHKQGKFNKTQINFIEEGKNIGKSNQTNTWTQTLRDGLSLYNKQLAKIDKNKTATTTASAANANENATIKNNSEKTEYKPMLVSKLGDLKKLALENRHNLYIQKKYNGVCCIIFYDYKNDEVILQSRSGKPYPTLDHLRVKDILKDFDKYTQEEYGSNAILHGEIYCHGMQLEEISGLVRQDKTDKKKSAKSMQLKQEKLEKQINLKFYIFDIFLPDKIDLPFSQRNKIVSLFCNKYKYEHFVCVETWMPNFGSESDCNRSSSTNGKFEEGLKSIEDYYKNALKDGYEGIILRLGDKPYQYSNKSYHSKYILKLKPTLDAEFEILDFTEGKNGKAKGALMWILKTPEGEIFNVTPKGELEERKTLFKELSEKSVEDPTQTVFEKKYKGKLLKVEFQEYSKKGIPTQPRAIALRDQMDLS